MKIHRDTLPAVPVTRFAPSVTGRMHLGHVAHAVFVWGLARASGGTVVLRLEDHDRGRYRRADERAILDDLAWLGFVADRDVGRQSDADPVYHAALRTLPADAVFACDCTRRRIAAAGGGEGGELRYDGRCRDRGLAAEPGRALRFRIEPGGETFRDVRHGDRHQDPAEQCGDVALRDRTGQWTYHWSVVVDDHRQGVNLVVRGDDLLASTGRQLRLLRALGASAPPTYLHHPLVCDADGVKLSKRTGATAIAERRAAGDTPAQVVGEAAHRVGLLPAPSAWPASAVGDLFTWI